MNILKRKTPQNIRFGEQKPKYYFHIRAFAVLLGVFFLLGVYFNWQSILEKMDDKPISAFALVGQNTFTTDNDIKESLLKMGELKGFWGQDVAPIQAQIEALPWVKGAIVRKMWPNRLSIWVSEYQPVAFWNQNQFVTLDGIVFQLPSVRLTAKNLPYLGGPDYQSLKVIETWNQIYVNLKSNNIMAKGVNIDDRGAWQVQLDNDIVLKLGRGDWKSKLERFVTIYPQIDVPENKKIDYIDLRYTTGAAVGMVDR
ncbi:TPA: cell division protein FtsQ/DivIB [Haemophilus influenzae]|uniref:cell division protein FtsQ/DivIB n=1 Tax=Haemophilus influenzae TaxID=727 RepID=UPI000D001E33|nr:cell division protein FtsQ/DivIB [Haemophilus influenzae]PRI73732.1 Cell division protein FtsQ [Haemophilus influenzae]PRJ88129.1 Cell division protein FtsQ [Haemophilus influenzae]PRK62183.1 Cell division protein FtsQ [Haemophilus influenzae]PRM02714.1 Cell division protein FtsQ [Haemophilus influenzae]PRM06626.1 Cell division protein FtsQ [Haemophilus influenzae]